MLSFTSRAAAACSLLCAARLVSGQALSLDVTDTESIKNAAAGIAYHMMTQYPGNLTDGIPGLFGSPYYWWEAGAAFGGLVDYWHYTGDTSYNNVTTQALLFQVGADDDYMPANQTSSLGNDDQSFWALAAMRAAEVNFPNPPADDPQWLALVQAVFNEQIDRWDDSTCGGGLRWQIFTFNDGYTYKNSISNGCFFNIGARLGAYTGNDTYLDWAEKAWDWEVAIGLIDDYNIYDGSSDLINCTEIDHIQWTYNAGVYIYGAATMWNVTGDDKWKNRTIGLWERTAEVFYVGNDSNIMSEVACEPSMDCTVDQFSFKAYLSRWLGVTMQVAPFMQDLVEPYMTATAQAVATSCETGAAGTICGTRWYDGDYDGTTGVGQQLSAMETVQALLWTVTQGPLSNTTGGTSAGDPSAGTGGSSSSSSSGSAATSAVYTRAITAGDKAGAAIFTLVLLGGLGATVFFMIIE